MAAICVGCNVLSSDLGERFGTTEQDSIRVLQIHGVFKNEFICPVCNVRCKQIAPNKIRVRCQKMIQMQGVKRKCNYSRSMKVGTWLEDAHLSMSKVCKFIISWLTISHPRQIYLQREIRMSSASVVHWSALCREICINSVVMLDAVTVGGPGVVVELDEAKFGKRKYNRGRVVEGSWIFGGFERGTKRCFFETVQDRSSATLMEVILRRIAPGTTIITDMWRGYNALINHQQFQHLTVNHSLNFVDPLTGAHTQNIERTWREVRSNIPRFGRNKNNNDGYLAEYYWKSRYEIEERFHYFLREIARQFPP